MMQLDEPTFGDVARLLKENSVSMRHEKRGIGLCIHGLWMLIPKGWEKKPASWLHVLGYAPLIKEKAAMNG